MPVYTLNRNHVLRTTSGVISFYKGEKTFVPKHMEREALAIGAEIVDGEAPDPLGPEKVLPAIPAGEDRREQIIAAIEMLVERNDSSDFTGSGSPSVKAVARLLGFDVERSELADAWGEVKIKLAEAK